MKTAMITGCLGGIGKASVKKFLAEGWQVIGLDVVDASKNDVDSPYFTYLQGDMASPEGRRKFLDTALSRSSTIDALVNVAGVAPRVRNDILEMTEESYDFVMGVNTKGTMFLTQIVAKEMMKNNASGGIRGYICNISSMSAYTSSTSRGEYCISKAGVSMITKLFADRLAPEGIMVNEIRPGIIRTGMTATVQAKYDKLIFEDGILPIKRWGEPEDIADNVYALCSGALPYVTGQSIDVDGGFHIQRL